MDSISDSIILPGAAGQFFVFNPCQNSYPPRARKTRPRNMKPEANIHPITALSCSAWDEFI
jgi:hypothetical protein